MRQNGSNPSVADSPSLQLLQRLNEESEFLRDRLCQPKIPKNTFNFPVEFYVTQNLWRLCRQKFGQKNWFEFIQKILDEAKHSKRYLETENRDSEIRILDYDSKSDESELFNRIQVIRINDYGDISFKVTIQ